MLISCSISRGRQVDLQSNTYGHKLWVIMRPRIQEADCRGVLQVRSSSRGSWELLHVERSQLGWFGPPCRQLTSEVFQLIQKESLRTRIKLQGLYISSRPGGTGECCQGDGRLGSLTPASSTGAVAVFVPLQPRTDAGCFQMFLQSRAACVM